MMYDVAMWHSNERVANREIYTSMRYKEREREKCGERDQRTGEGGGGIGRPLLLQRAMP